MERVWGGIGGEEWGGDGKDREGMGRGGEGGSILAPPCPPLPVISDPLPPKSSVFSLAKRDKKPFFSDQCKEIEENNGMGKTRDLFKKIRHTKKTFHANMGSITISTP